MKVHDNTEKLIQYLLEHPQPTTVAGIVMAGVMNSRDASDAIRYGVRNAVIEHVKAPDASSWGQVRYRWTGEPLPPVKRTASRPSFDALLDAWGITRVPPLLPTSTAPQTVTFS